MRVSDGLVGDGCAPGLQKIAGLIWVRSEVQVSEDDLAAPKLLTFRRERLFDLYDQVRFFEYSIGNGVYFLF